MRSTENVITEKNVNNLKPARKKIIIQIILYVIISFGIMYVTGAFYLKKDGYLVKHNLTEVSNFLYLLGIFSPLIACVILRYSSGEGFKDGIMLPKFTGHFMWYFIAVLAPLFMGLIGCLLVTCSLHAGFSFKNDYSFFVNMLNPAISLDMVYFNMFILLGEELGWRAYIYDKLEDFFRSIGSQADNNGKHIYNNSEDAVSYEKYSDENVSGEELGWRAYLYDKLEELFSGNHKRAVSLSVIIGGTLWGLWHAQLVVVSGLNYGKDYAGYPYVGIILMCISCIFMGAFLQLLRKKTDSVIAPTLAHAVIDSCIPAIVSMFLSGNESGNIQFTFGIYGLLVPAIVVGIPSWYSLLRESGK